MTAAPTCEARFEPAQNCRQYFPIRHFCISYRCIRPGPPAAFRLHYKHTPLIAPDMELPWDPVHSAATAGMPPVATYPSPPPPLQPLHSTPPTAFYNTHPHPGFSIPPLPGAPAPAPVPLASPVVDKPRRGRRRRLNAEPSYDTEMGHEDLAATHPASPLSAAASASSRKGVVIKTKFPVARIKRIMQADEDVGKVAQVCLSTR